MNASSAPLQPTVVRLWLQDDLDARGKKTRRILASPDPFMAFAGHPLIFASEMPFAIHFNDAFPLAGPLEPLTRDHEWMAEVEWEHVYRSEGGLGYYQGQLARPDAARLEYFKYTVAICEGDRVYMVDPEGVFERDPRPKDTNF